MKALDTSALVALLEGDPRVRQVVKHWRGEEIATTEANLLELALIAGGTGARSRSARFASLGRLRRRMTVLPIDARAGEEAQRRLEKGGPPIPLTALAMLSALETSGCEELLTDDPAALPGKWRFRVSRIDHKATTKRK